jgi:hypothetical protein
MFIYGCMDFCLGCEHQQHEPGGPYEPPTDSCSLDHYGKDPCPHLDDYLELEEFRAQLIGLISKLHDPERRAYIAAYTADAIVDAYPVGYFSPESFVRACGVADKARVTP